MARASSVASWTIHKNNNTLLRRHSAGQARQAATHSHDLGFSDAKPKAAVAEASLFEPTVKAASDKPSKKGALGFMAKRKKRTPRRGAALLMDDGGNIGPTSI